MNYIDNNLHEYWWKVNKDMVVMKCELKNEYRWKVEKNMNIDEQEHEQVFVNIYEQWHVYRWKVHDYLWIGIWVLND